MVKETPSFGKILAMVAFVMSCVGILLYLWLTFGGSIPLRPEGYRFSVRFPEATQLAQEADVRISGVNVGKVRKKLPEQETGLTDATIEIDSRYAPLPIDTRTILRQKTLLGETYVELSPGDRSKPKLEDGGRLPQAQVADAVQLDEIFRAFDPKTRIAFSNYLDQQGVAVGDRGQSINDALGTLTPFAQDVDAGLRILNRQDGATRRLVRDTGYTFDALSERRGQLRGLINNSNRVFSTTAARNRELADTFVAFPTFLRESRLTLTRLTKFSEDTNPLITQLRPAARELSPTLIDLNALAPDLRGFLADLGPLVTVFKTGLPALQRVLEDLRPLLARTEVWLRDVQPILDYVGLYKREIGSFFANDSASTQATGAGANGSGQLHYLRTTNPVGPEVLAAYPGRLLTNRPNPYVQPGGYDRLAKGLEVFGSYASCKSTLPAPVLGDIGDPVLTGLIGQFVLPPSGAPAPACKEQAPLGGLVGQTGKYPRLQPLPAP